MNVPDVCVTSPGAGPRVRRPRSGAALVGLMALVGCGFTLLVYYPGYMSNDSVVQLRQARSGVLEDNHPPLMAAVWSLLDRAWPGPAGMLALQNLLFWGGLALVCLHLPGSRAFHAAGVLLIGLFPPLFGLLGTVWKDELMLAARVLATGLILWTHSRGGGVVRGALVGLALLLAAAARHNAIVAIPPLLFWLLHAYRRLHARRRGWTFVRLTALSVGAAGVLHLAAGLLSRSLTEVQTDQWQCIPIYDLVGMSVHADCVLIPAELDICTEPLSRARLRELYTPRTLNALWHPPADNPSAQPPFPRIVDPEKLATLRTHWLAMVRAHPGAYWRHRWGTFRQLIGLPPAELYGPVHWNRINENELGIEFRDSRLNTAVMQLLRWFCDTPLYRVWIYLLALLVLVPCGAWWYARSGHTMTLALSSSGLLCLLGYFPTTPSASFRYSNWSILTALLVLWALLVPAVGRLAAPLRRRRQAANLARSSAVA